MHENVIPSLPHKVAIGVSALILAKLQGSYNYE